MNRYDYLLHELKEAERKLAEAQAAYRANPTEENRRRKKAAGYAWAHAGNQMPDRGHYLV